MAIGYRRLKHITVVHIKEDNFQLNLRQGLTKRSLHLEAGSFWTEYLDNQPFEYYYDVPHKQFDQLLHKIMDRKIRPGLSRRALQKIVRYVDVDYKWYGMTEEEVEGTILVDLNVEYEDLKVLEVAYRRYRTDTNDGSEGMILALNGRLGKKAKRRGGRTEWWIVNFAVV